MAAAPDFLSPILTGIYYVLFGITAVVEVFAFVHCVTRRKAAFLAVGNVPKSGWVALTGGAVAFSLLFFGATAFAFSFVSMFALIALIIALVYLLDVRPALRDAVDGRGSSW
jgi:hypothetical protein